jgi:hypothetical protein
VVVVSNPKCKMTNLRIQNVIHIGSYLVKIMSISLWRLQLPYCYSYWTDRFKSMCLIYLLCLLFPFSSSIFIFLLIWENLIERCRLFLVLYITISLLTRLKMWSQVNRNRKAAFALIWLKWLRRIKRQSTTVQVFLMADMTSYILTQPLHMNVLCSNIKF